MIELKILGGVILGMTGLMGGCGLMCLLVYGMGKGCGLIISKIKEEN